MIVTRQIAPVVANAGVTQTVSIGGSPTSLLLGGMLGGGTTVAGAGGGGTQSGPGWATLGNTSTGTPLNADGKFDKTQWPKYLFFGALAYFAWQKLKK